MFASAHDDDEWADGSFDDGALEDGESDDRAPRAPEMHEGMPITGWYRGEPIPDLTALPQERWLEVLRPLSHWPRIHATAGLPTLEQSRAAAVIKGQLMLEDGAARARAHDGPPPRMPSGVPPARGASHQVNFRLGPAEHARLAQAAKLFAVPPTTLARMLTMRGVDRALYEERRDR